MVYKWHILYTLHTVITLRAAVAPTVRTTKYISASSFENNKCLQVDGKFTAILTTKPGLTFALPTHPTKSPDQGTGSSSFGMLPSNFSNFLISSRLNKCFGCAKPGTKMWCNGLRKEMSPSLLTFAFSKNLSFSTDVIQFQNRSRCPTYHLWRAFYFSGFVEQMAV